MFMGTKGLERRTNVRTCTHVTPKAADSVESLYLQSDWQYRLSTAETIHDERCTERFMTTVVS
jgi:hypothetical protein